MLKNLSIKNVILAVAIIAAVGFFGRSCWTDSNFEKWKTDFKNYRDSVSVVLANATKDSIVSAEHEAAADSVGQIADSLQVVVDSIGEVADSASEVNERNFQDLINDVNATKDEWIGVAIGFREERDIWKTKSDSLQGIANRRLVQVTDLEFSLAASRRRANSLQITLNNMPGPPPDEKFLFIKLPSRKASFSIGAVLGVILGFAVK